MFRSQPASWVRKWESLSYIRLLRPLWTIEFMEFSGSPLLTRWWHHNSRSLPSGIKPSLSAFAGGFFTEATGMPYWPLKLFCASPAVAYSEAASLLANKHAVLPHACMFRSTRQVVNMSLWAWVLLLTISRNAVRLQGSPRKGTLSLGGTAQNVIFSCLLGQAPRQEAVLGPPESWTRPGQERLKIVIAFVPWPC